MPNTNTVPPQLPADYRERVNRALFGYATGQSWPGDIWWTAPTLCAICSRLVLIETGGWPIADQEEIRAVVTAARLRRDTRCPTCTKNIAAAGWVRGSR